MPTVMCPTCEAVVPVAGPAAATRCPECDEPISAAELAATYSDGADEQRPAAHEGHVLLARGLKMYRAIRAGHDLLVLHVGDAKQDLPVAALRTWTPDNYRDRIRRFVWLKCVLPAVAALGILAFIVVQFAGTFGGDQVDPAYVAGPVVLVLLVLGLVILQRVRTTGAYVRRLGELDAMTTDDRRDAAERKPNLYFPEEDLLGLKVVRADADPHAAAKWLLVVTDRRQGEWTFDLVAKEDRMAVGPALGDLVDDYVAPPKPKPRPEADLPVVEPAGAAPSPAEWFFALVGGPNGLEGYRVYPSATQLLLVHTGGRGRKTDAGRALAVFGGAVAAIAVACAAVFVALGPGKFSWLVALVGLTAGAGLVGVALSALRVARRERELDGLTADELLLELNGNRSRAIDLRAVEDGTLNYRGEYPTLTLEDRRGVRRRLVLVADEDAAAARRVCKTLLKGVVRVVGGKKQPE